MSAISQKYQSLDGSNGFLKNPVNPESACPDGIGRFRHYESGSIYWSPASGAHEVHGQIRWQWSSIGWERSFIGYPLTDELNTPDGGRYSKFQKGYIAWTRQMRAKVLSDGPNQNHVGNELNLSNLTATSAGNLKTFYENMREWYGIDLKKGVIRRSSSTASNISGWPFVDLSKTDIINNTKLKDGERLIITVAQILLMQWYMRDLKNNDSTRRSQIKAYCRGCFKMRTVIRKFKIRWKYHKWCSEFVSYVYRRCGEQFKIHHIQAFMCSNIAKLKNKDWCCRNVSSFRKEFSRRNRWTNFSPVQNGSYELQAGDYIRTNSHSMLVLGVDRSKSSNQIYIVHGNVGSGKPEDKGKGVALGWKDINNSGLVGVGRSPVYLPRIG